MSSKDPIFSDDSGFTASLPQGAPLSGVWPDSLVKKTLLPAVSRFYAAAIKPPRCSLCMETFRR